MATPKRAVVATCIAAAGLAGCSGSVSNDEVDRRAQTAGTVMSRGNDPIPTRFAAALVTGTSGPVTIEALEATGTTASGRVVLRIDYAGQGFDIERIGVTRCFRYDFDGPATNAEPHSVGCGHRPPIVLPDPSTLPTVTDAVRERVRAVLVSLSPAARLDPTQVRTAVRSAVGFAYTVRTFRDPAAGVGVRISAADTCVSGTTRPVAMRPTAAGADCQA